ncbi:MAG: YfcE family phosphodiesterase [Candidatus Nitrosocosmicus sp.]|nr:YfcE family phosphodiesterase [Candidatus Nitrosocosmicus sp.]MDN5867444.1 YfcE family phosphodiesterase [Candidatus Nitrosocosmicus sp.]
MKITRFFMMIKKLLIVKIGAISDTHDDVENTERAINIFNLMKVDHVFHADDYVYPGMINLFKKLDKEIKFYGVRGNNDGELMGITKQFDEIKNAQFLNEFGKLNLFKKIGVYHGTNSDLSGSLLESQLFDILILGHTHIKRIEKMGKTLVLNPGPLNRDFFSKKTNDGPCIIIYDEKRNTAEFVDINSTKNTM